MNKHWILALGLALPAQDSAAELFERAVYAEEHERDLDGAAELLARVAAAERGPDGAATPLGRQAEERLARLRGEARQDDAADQDEIEAAIAARMYSARDHDLRGNTTGRNEAIADLTVFGKYAVPFLKQGCLRAVEVGGTVIEPRAQTFARPLARMDCPEATQALRELLTQPNPFARREVAANLDPQQHRELLLLAARDAVADVRDLALERLTRARGAELVPLLRAACLEGQESAAAWILREAPDEAQRMLVDPATPARVRATLVSHAADEVRQPSEELLATFLSLARTAEGSGTRNSAMKAVFDWLARSRDEAGRAAIAAELATDLLAYPLQPAFAIVAAWTPPSSLPAMARALSEAAERVDPEDTNGGWEVARQHFESALGKATSSDLALLAAAFGELPEPGLAPARMQTRSGALWNLVEQKIESLSTELIPASDMASAFAALDPLHQSTLLGWAASWVANHVSEDDPGSTPIDATFRPVAKALLDAPRERYRTQALMAFGAIGAPSDLPVLLETASDNSRARALEAIVSRDPEGAERVLEDAIAGALEGPADVLTRRIFWANKALDSGARLRIFTLYWPHVSDVEPKTALLFLLCDLPGPEVSALLLEHYDDIPAEHGSNLRARAIARFTEELFEPAIPLLGAALGDPNEQVRKAAKIAFDRFRENRAERAEFERWRRGDAHEQETVDELLALLDSTNPEVVAGAVKTLGALKVQAAYPRLLRLLDREEPQFEIVRQTVKQVIDGL